MDVVNWFREFFEALFSLIPKIIYLFYASLACVLDVLQLFFRKLAGLDVYYVNGKKVGGDIVTNFISGILGIQLDQNNTMDYSSLATVFWAFIIFGIVILFATTIFAVIKSHYNYDDKAKKGPMQYVYTAVRSVVSMAVVPILCVLGLYLSQVVLTAVDTITSVSSGTLESADMFGSYLGQNCVYNSTQRSGTATNNSNERTYIYYDIFGVESYIFYEVFHESTLTDNQENLAKVAATNQTFSGTMFKLAAYNANRARSGGLKSWNIGSGKNGECTLFANAGNNNEKLADLIDEAFANNLHLRQSVELDKSNSNAQISTKYFTNFLTHEVVAFSKFNVGLVWYFYDLWTFNFIIGFGAVIFCLTVFINIIMGLISRLFFCIGLFLIAPPLFGLAPLDGGKAQKAWQENFIQQVLMAYGSVVGMNLVFLILPFFNKIDFFNITIADYFVQTIVIIAGLITIKSFIATLSKIVGGADAFATGEKVAGDMKKPLGAAVGLTLGVGKLAAGVATGGMALAAKGAMKGADLLARGGTKVFDAAANKIDKKRGGTGTRFNSREGYENFKGNLKEGVDAAKQTVTDLKDTVTGKMKFGVRAAEDEQKELDAIKAQNAFIDSMDGQAVLSDKDLKKQIANAGIKGSAAEDMLNAIKTSSRRGGSSYIADEIKDKFSTSSSGSSSAGHYRFNDMLSGGHFSESIFNRYQSQTSTNYDRAITRQQHSGRYKFAKGFTSAAGKVKDFGGKMGGYTYTALGQSNDFMETFLHESGIRKKTNFDKLTEAHTSDALVEAKFQSYLQEWMAQHPGAAPSKEVIASLRAKAKKK